MRGECPACGTTIHRKRCPACAKRRIRVRSTTPLQLCVLCERPRRDVTDGCCPVCIQRTAMGVR